MTRQKSFVSDMAWSAKRGKVEFAWVEARMALQFNDDVVVPEQLYVSCQWRMKGNRIPEHWTFTLIYRGMVIYAIHVQPTSKHPNHVGKGRKYYQQEIDGVHEHIWVEEGEGYAEPIDVPLHKPEVIWRMFLSRANIDGADFFHPDQNQPGLDL